MRGEVLQYDDNAGAGLISGDDGVRYQFTRSDMRELRPLYRGMRVDFVAREDGSASEIYILQAQTTFDRPLESSNEDLDLWGYFAKAMRLSFNGEGRARRKEYWSFVLFSVLFIFGGLVVAGIVAGLASYSAYGYTDGGYGDTPMVSGLLALAIIVLVLWFVPANITVTIRRLHDIGLTGWFIFIALVPYVGALVLFIMSLLPSERRVNKHGPYPKPLEPQEWRTLAQERMRQRLDERPRRVGSGDGRI